MAGLLDNLMTGNPGLLGGQQLSPFQQGLARIAGGPRDPDAERRHAIETMLKVYGLKLQERALEEKPQLKEIELPDGSKGLAEVTVGGGFKQVWPRPAAAGAEGGTPTNAAPATPPGMSARVMRDERTKEAVKQEQELVTSARQASTMMPKVDEMINSYKIMMDRGAIGPWAGGSIARTIGQYIPPDTPEVKRAFPGMTGEAEASRQNYERRKSPVQAYITSLQNKGQGPVSEWERKLFGLALPGFTDLDPGEQLKVMEDLRTEMQTAIKAGKASPIAATPGVSEALQPQQSKAGPKRPTSEAEYRALPSGSQYIAPDGTTRTKK